MPRQTPDSSPDDLGFALLGAGLRSRAGTVGELAGLARREEAEVREALATLQADGFVELDGDQVRYVAPEEAFAAVVRRRLGDLSTDLLARLGDLAETVEHLPALARDWAVDNTGSEIFDVQVFHGPEAVVDLWHVKQASEPARRTDVVLPDASALYVSDPDMQKVWHEASSGEGRRARVLASIDDGTHPEAQTRIQQELAGGVEIRLMAQPPGWFWVTDATTVALPLVWGERWPTSVVSIRSRAVAGMATWVFERLWERAVPVGTGRAAWDPLLSLMMGGATLEAASRTLGMSERTGRRRVAEAMDHFGAGSMLALGGAWTAARRR